MPAPLQKPMDRRLAAGLALLALVYFFAVRLSLLFPDSAQAIAAIWPPSGIALAAMLLFPRAHRWMPLAVVGAVNLAGNLTSGKALPESAGFMAANVSEAALATWFITRWFEAPVIFVRVRGVLALVGAAVLMNACSAVLGAGTAWLTLKAPFWEVYESWLIADGLGMLLVTPVIVTVATSAKATWLKMRWAARLELMVFAAALCSAVWLIFGPRPFDSTTHLRPYLFVPILTWAALRFPPWVAATSSLLLAVVAVCYVDVSPGALLLGPADPALRLEFVQTYIAILALSALFLAVSTHESALTARKLHESEEQYRLLFLSSNDAVLVGTPDGKILRANPAASRMLGWTEEEFRALGRGGLVEPNDHRQAPYLAERERTGKARAELTLLHKDGRRIPGEVSSARYFDLAGQELVCVILRDITERKSFERRLADAAEQERQRIGRNLHDDMGQDLTAISYQLFALKKDLAGRGDAQESPARIDTITSSLNQVSGRIQGLSRGLYPKVFESASLQEALGSLAESASQNLTIDCRYICKTEHDTRDGDTIVSLYRIAQEAITNAVRHGRAGLVEIRQDAHNGACLIRISNDGRPIEKPSQLTESNGLGWRNMCARADLIGAQLEVLQDDQGRPVIQCRVTLP